MEVELLEIRDFLAEHPPFDQLPGDALDRLPKELSVRYLRRGTPFPPADADQPYLYLVRKGALELRNAQEDLIGKYAEGELYPAPCMNETGRGLSGVTVEDSLFYCLPCTRLDALCREYPAFREHFHHSATERLRRALERLQAPPRGGGGLMTVEVGDLVGRAPVTASPETSIQGAARIMSRERVSSLLIMEDRHLVGLVTDRDLRSRCIAEGLSYEEPVSSIMTRKLHKVSRDTPAFEALITMTRLNVHHLPVTGTGGVLGVVSTNDLIRHESANAVYLVGDIGKSGTVAELQAASRQLPELQVQIVASGATGYHVGQAISSIADALTRRLLELAEQRLGPPPVPYCWLAVGSQARREQTVHSDQDNALLLGDDYLAQEHGDYFQRLAEFVGDGLDACGFVYCPGEVMARNPQWRQSLRGWRALFDRWITRPERKALMLASNFFDMRPVFGDSGLYDRLHAEVLQQTRDNRIFLAALAANALRTRPPLGFFRGFVLVGDGDHADSVDLKRGGVIPAIDLARVFALSAGLPEINTCERLKAAAEAGTLSESGAANLEDALELLTTLRARHQTDQIKRGEAPDNYVRPDQLSSLERGHLKDAFSVIGGLQSTLAQRYQTERFG